MSSTSFWQGGAWSPAQVSVKGFFCVGSSDEVIGNRKESDPETEAVYSNDDEENDTYDLMLMDLMWREIQMDLVLMLLVKMEIKKL